MEKVVHIHVYIKKRVVQPLENDAHNLKHISSVC